MQPQYSYNIDLCFRFGVGKKGMEKICCEELEFLVKEIKSKADSSFDISVRELLNMCL